MKRRPSLYAEVLKMLSKAGTPAGAVAVIVDGPEADEDSEGNEIPVWFVGFTDGYEAMDEGSGKSYSYEDAVHSGEELARRTGLPLQVDAAHA